MILEKNLFERVSVSREKTILNNIVSMSISYSLAGDVLNREESEF